jgi:hypothetical protein
MKNFAVERKRGQFQIHTFDKETERSFRTAVEKVAVESDFNALDQDGVRISLEAGMGMVESEAAILIAAIVRGGRLPDFSPSQRMTIDLFCALQFIRGTATRAQFSHLISSVNRRMRAIAERNGSEYPVILPRFCGHPC